MKIYNKLIRDRIPEIIRASGKQCRVTVLAPEPYLVELNRKLAEELQEYLETEDLTELADLVEVIYAIIKQRGVELEEFDALRRRKSEERGAFDKRLLLIDVADQK